MFKRTVVILFKTLFLFSFWIVLSGKMQLFYLIVGFLTSLTIALLATSPASPSQQQNPLAWPLILVRSILYAGWLLTKIIQAAVHVSKIVLSPVLKIDPKLITHETPLKQDWERVIFSNSITLTPGTITADLKGDVLMVHQLDDSSAGDIQSGAMEREILKILKIKAH